MFKSAFVLALLSTVCACTAPQPAAVDSASAQKTKRVCTDVIEEATGSRTNTYQVCKDVPVDEAGTSGAQEEPQS